MRIHVKKLKMSLSDSKDYPRRMNLLRKARFDTDKTILERISGDSVEYRQMKYLTSFPNLFNKQRPILDLG